MKRIVLGIFSISCLIIGVITLSSNSLGITGVSSSGCTCHGSQSAATVLGITGFPTNYVLGQAYPITVSVANASQLAGGFDLTVSLGTISAASVGTTIQPSLQEIGHNTPKSFTSGSCSWTFTWTAPASGSSAVTVNYAGNAVNLANGSSGDVWNKTTLTVGAPLVAPTVTATTSAILCNGGTSTITCTGTGGTTPYQYKLNAGSYQSSNVFSGNVAGTYTITIKGANSATSSTIKTITQPSLISLNTNSTNVSCNGGANGTASVVASGGTGTYSYLWSPSGGAAATASGLSAGIYTCTVTDVNACTKTATFNITHPAAITNTSSSINVSCNGGANGTATVVASGGAGSYTYFWSPSGGTAATATGLTAGVYTCTITDANACNKLATFNITQPTAITNTSSSANVSCNGGSNGTASVVASGGAGSYSYFWSPSGATAATATGLTAGAYTCTITDANACNKLATFNITQPTAITNTSSSTNVSCNGGSNGTASVVASGGVASYTYSWLPFGGTAATSTGLTAGVYTCTITDANSCNKTATFSITQPTALTTNISSSTNVTCFGGSNGAATISASGGNPGYSYNWTPGNPTGDGTSSVSGLIAGTWTCTVTDANFCTGASTVNITQPAFVDVIANASSTNLCAGNTLTLFGSNSASNPNYTYTWTGSVNNNTPFVASTTNTYTVTGTNSNGCTDQGTITVNVNTNNDLALSSTGNVSSVPGSVCVTMQQLDGQTANYTNASCASMASIFDQAGGNNLGNVNVCIDVLTSVQTYNGEPYSARVYTITPTNQGPATITLFYTHDDIVKLNNYITSNASPYPLLNYPNASPLNGDQITNASITKVSGGALGVGTGTATPVTLTYNATKHAWVATLAVSSFSSFYLHSSNFGNAALPVELVSFEGSNGKNEQLLKWLVYHEENISAYQLEHSTNGDRYETISVTPALSLTQPGHTFSYRSSFANPSQGHNYYRLKGIDLDNNQSLMSQVLDIRFTPWGTSLISLWPNPTSDDMNLRVDASEMTLLQTELTDATGKIIQRTSLDCFPGNNTHVLHLNHLAEGIYWLKVTSPEMGTSVLQLSVRR